MNQQSFALGIDFPREGFVQNAIEKHFAALGYLKSVGGYVGYDGIQPVSGDRWIVDAKGETSEVGLDFRTGLGQILLAMAEYPARYGLAIPNTSKFSDQCTRVPNRVRTALRLHWLLVDAAGGVTIVGPDDELASFDE